MHDFLKIIGPKRELQHVDKSPSKLSHGVNKILSKLGKGGNFPTDRDKSSRTLFLEETQ